MWSDCEYLQIVFEMRFNLTYGQCASCKRDTQHTCQSCGGDYCIEHNEGCSATMVSSKMRCLVSC